MVVTIMFFTFIGIVFIASGKIKNEVEEKEEDRGGEGTKTSDDCDGDDDCDENDECDENDDCDGDEEEEARFTK